MAKEDIKNSSNMATIALIVAALLVLVGIVAYAWNAKPGDNNKATAKCTTVVKDGTAADVDKLGPNEVKLTAENFDAEVIQYKGVVLVDAYAPWCPHCQRITPTISKLADDFLGKVKVGRMNANNQDVAMKANFDFAVKNGLEGYPTIWIYKDGKIVDSFSGERTYCEIKELLDKQL